MLCKLGEIKITEFGLPSAGMTAVQNFVKIDQPIQKFKGYIEAQARTVWRVHKPVTPIFPQKVEVLRE
jgi:hypothetical protein